MNDPGRAGRIVPDDPTWPSVRLPTDHDAATPFPAGESRSGHPFADAPGPLRSLNAARVVALPDDLATDDVIGRRGVELVSGLWLGREVAGRASELGLDPESSQLLRDFAGCLTNRDVPASARALAGDIALRLGRRLGCLLLMLARGEPANRAARPDWGDEQWRLWAGVGRVVIGGGLLAGAIGDVALPAAQAVLDAHDAGHVRLARSPWGDGIALVGLARLLPVAAEQRGVLDFGQTSVKRGVARYRAGRLAGLRVLPAQPCFCSSPIGLSTERAEIERQWAAMLDLTVETAGKAGSRPGDAAEVSICLACYLRDGRPDPLDARSCYGRLQALGPDLAELAGSRLADRLGSEVRFRLLDDGTAAALAVEPDETCVVLTIGTAIGVGFPLARHPRAPLEHGFRLD
jgi:hypothetical protein